MKPELEKVEDTYCEAFDGLVSRVIVTADEEYGELEQAVRGSTALPSIVVGRTEAGVERWLSKEETPDGRRGALIQFWGYLDRSKPLQESVNKFVKDLAIRIRQGILVVPTTAVFNALDSQDKMDMMPWVGKCGGGYEWVELSRGADGIARQMITVPIMMGRDFRIERYLSYKIGVCGASLWLMCDSVEAGRRISHKALKAVEAVDDVVTPFGVCAAGSKPDDYPLIGPTTNHWFCPTLKDKLKGSRVPEGVKSIPEIVINGITLAAVKEAIAAGIDAVEDERGLLRISAGNYGGKLGQHRIFLKEALRFKRS
jgi:formylmethanofuran--tetrahydromethanopterin N-formyltransferase